MPANAVNGAEKAPQASAAERSPEELARLLQEEFGPGEVKLKAQTVRGDRALAVAYVDARAVMDRLDKVFGVGGWQTRYRDVKDGVVCTLRVRVGGEWIEHEDVGGESEQPDDGDQRKAAHSDSLKRAAVHLGIGRYLYRLESKWVDYDPAKRQLRTTPAARSQAPPPAAKMTAEQVAYELKSWKEWLDEGPDRQAVNETVRADLPKSPREVKQHKWEMVLAYAKRSGWGAWSAQENGFTETAKEKAAS